MRLIKMKLETKIVLVQPRNHRDEVQLRDQLPQLPILAPDRGKWSALGSGRLNPDQSIAAKPQIRTAVHVCLPEEVRVF